MQRRPFKPMETLELDTLSITKHKFGVTLDWRDGEAGSTALNHDELDTLIEFLQAQTPSDRRVGFRVPLTDGDLDVSVKTTSKTVAAKALDLSLTGILLELPEHTLAADRQCTVTLSLNNHSVVLAATTIRTEGNIAAMHFPTTVHGGELDPPDELVTIYRSLEQAWLKSRQLD